MAETVMVQCLACRATRHVPMEKYIVGDILQPFPGGGDYGKCLKCNRGGLRVIEIPRVGPTKPTGWRKVPEV